MTLAHAQLLHMLPQALLQPLGPVAFALGSAAQFEPHQSVYDGYTWGCTAPELPCGNMCTNSGRYCR